MANPCDFFIDGNKLSYDQFIAHVKGLPSSELSDILGGIPSFRAIPKAPFVTDTNAVTKLALKQAIREAVAQGAERVAWTTGEQQNSRYDLRKTIDEIRYSKNDDGTYGLVAYKG